MPLDVEAVLAPWVGATLAAAGRPPLFDAHTHIGRNDPDGMRSEPEELVASLARTGARGLVFPMHEPGGYPPANDAVRAAVAAAGGRLEWLCRVDPRAPGAVGEARRCLGAGARGIKLHPRAENFGMDEPVVGELVALAHERRAPVLIHAGRGIPALGEHTVRLAREFPGARMILAHCAISDLAWLWRALPDHPNVLVDTSWWHPSDLLALFSLVAPRHVLWASDAPYGLPGMSVLIAGRSALQAGLGPEAMASVLGGQIERVIAGQALLDPGPAPCAPPPLDPLLERAMVHLTVAIGRVFVHADAGEAVGLTRLACAVGDGAPHAQLCSEVLELLDLYERHAADPVPPGRVFPAATRLLIAALVLLRTPDVPLPDRAGAPHPTRAEAEPAAPGAPEGDDLLDHYS